MEKYKPSTTTTSVLNYQVTSAFLNGFPESIDKVTEDQAHILYNYGGDMTMLFLYQIPKLYSTAHNEAEENAEFDKEKQWSEDHPGQNIYEDKEIQKSMVTRRERVALGEIIDFFAKNPGQQSITLTYGASHDFKRHPNLFPSACVEIPGQFAKAYADYHHADQ